MIQFENMQGYIINVIFLNLFNKTHYYMYIFIPQISPSRVYNESANLQYGADINIDKHGDYMVEQEDYRTNNEKPYRQHAFDDEPFRQNNITSTNVVDVVLMEQQHHAVHKMR